MKIYKGTNTLPKFMWLSPSMSPCQFLFYLELIYLLNKSKDKKEQIKKNKVFIVCAKLILNQDFGPSRFISLHIPTKTIIIQTSSAPFKNIIGHTLSEKSNGFLLIWKACFIWFSIFSFSCKLSEFRFSLLII